MSVLTVAMRGTGWYLDFWYPEQHRNRFFFPLLSYLVCSNLVELQSGIISLEISVAFHPATFRFMSKHPRRRMLSPLLGCVHCCSTHSKKYKQPEYPSIDEENWCRYAVECCCAVKKNDLTKFEDKWLELEKSTLRWPRPRKTQMCSLIWASLLQTFRC